MYDTSGTHSVCHATAHDNDTALRIAWLKGEVERAENRAELLRAEAEWERAALMRSPVTTEEAYAWFGTFLGLFPPFAIFIRIFGGGRNPERIFDGDMLPWLLLLLAMNAVCCYVGRRFGRVLGRSLGDPRAHDWLRHVVVSLLLGGAWAAVTGASGGAPFFGIGAVFGVACAIPVALATFPIFAALHRIQSHGGMIDEHDLWPIAFGIPLATAALIMSLGK
ncbi:MAG TPA: hypothetical protein VM936_19605 [Pyrinomonadaceae bacterium]|jgi:hypothetical protein|nr:hypothetical protein [Pyrinomonadaceae bacterium]